MVTGKNVGIGAGLCMPREVGLGTGEGEGGGILRTQRVSVACLVPVRKVEG